MIGSQGKVAATRSRLPAADEIEISIFGPSYGECIVIHLGNGDWLIVDSCISPKTGEPHAVEYLQSIGANLSKVRGIISTHWDSDHTKGISKCLQAAPNADFVIPAACYPQEFFTLLSLSESNKMGGIKGLEEIVKCFDLLRSRNRKPKFASENQHLYESHAAGSQWMETVALSPSSARILGGHLAVSKVLETVAKHRGHIPPGHRNDRSIALWLRLGNAIVLLGSDLEETGKNDEGWSAVISGMRRAQASVFKIPHHGSASGHVDSVWDSLVKKNPISVVTPWKRGLHSLPTRQDVERLQTKTDALYVTAIPQNKRKKRVWEVQTMINMAASNLSTIFSTAGHVRLRANSTTSSTKWKIELFNGARKISGRMSKTFYDPGSQANQRRKSA
jgi:beta-lactamase superfamily II metal-dependent hydrolase